MNRVRFSSCAKKVFVSVLLILGMFVVLSYGVYAIDITACGTLNQANTVYRLMNGINNYAGTCFTIAADNVTLDGNGKVIDGDGSGADYGVNVNGYNRAVIKNLTITQFGVGIRLYSSSNNQLLNVISNSNSYEGINLYSSSYNNFVNIVTNSNSNHGVYFYSSSNNQITNGLFNSNSLSGLYLYLSSQNQIANSNSSSNYEGIYFYSSPNNVFSNVNSNSNTLSGFYLFRGSHNNQIVNSISSNNRDGIYLYSSSNNHIKNNTLNNDKYGIYVASSSHNLFKDSLINAAITNAIYLFEPYTPNTLNNTFDNLLITNTASNARDLYLESASIEETGFINMLNIGKYYFTGVGGTVIVRNSQWGEVRFLTPVNGSGTNFTADIMLKNNSAYVNSSKTGLNKSANVTLYGIPTNLVNPKIMKNGQVCADCTALTSLNAGTVVFRVDNMGGEYSIVGDNFAASGEEILLGKGWNLIGTTSPNKISGDVLIPLQTGWNLISYSSENETLFNKTIVVLANGTEISIDEAARQNRIKKYFAYYDSSIGQKKFKYSFIDDARWRKGRGYWVFVSDTNPVSLKLRGIGGSLQNDSFDFNTLMFKNNVTGETKNITDAFESQWIGYPDNSLTFDSAIYYYEDGMFYNVPLDDSNVYPWKGYFIWSRIENLTMFRQD